MIKEIYMIYVCILYIYTYIWFRGVFLFVGWYYLDTNAFCVWVWISHIFGTTTRWSGISVALLPSLLEHLEEKNTVYLTNRWESEQWISDTLPKTKSSPLKIWAGNISYIPNINFKVRVLRFREGISEKCKVVAFFSNQRTFMYSLYPPWN